MFLLIYSGSRHGKESDRLGYQLIKVQSCQAKRAVVPKRLIRLLGRCSLLNILRTFSQNTFMVGRNEIHRSYPILGYQYYPQVLAIIVPKNVSTKVVP